MPTEEPTFGCVAFAGGGSGGHLNPSIAVAEEIRKTAPDCELLFFSSDRSVDRKVLSGAEVTSCRASIVSLSSPAGHELIRRPLHFVVSFTRACVQSFRVLRRIRPQVVLGTGGYVSVPAVLSAWVLRIPIVLLELNTVPGTATRVLSRFAAVICTGLPLSRETSDRLHRRIRWTGIPLRRRILHDQHPADTSGAQESGSSSGADVKRILILGGSQGASRLNQLMLHVFHDVSWMTSGWSIVHQTGESDFHRVSDFYQGSSLDVRVSPFLHDVGRELRAATIVIARAGASTIAEIACCGRAAILIPLSQSAGGHQQKNAAWVAEQYAAVIVDETSSDAGDALRRILCECCDHESKREELSRSMRALAMPDAAGAVTNAIRSEMKP